MPDKPAADRTEKPTPERLRRARSQGQIPQTQEVPSALMILMLLVALALMAPALYRYFSVQVRQGFSCQTGGPMEFDGFRHLLTTKARQSLLTLLPFFLAAGAVSIFGSLVGSGWSISAKAVRFDLARISPIKGLKNLFNLRSAMRLAVSLAKLSVVLVIVYLYLRDKLPVCLSLGNAAPEGVLVGIARLIFGLLVRVTVALMAIAAIDLLFQRWRYKQDLRMTRREVLDERRQHEVSPHVRGRIRAAQIEMVKKRMLQEVPNADLVVTNPTHVAVALQYKPETMDAPTVVAKGADLLSEKIREIARAHNVPIVQRPELARTLYSAVEVGQAIPETLFLAVAEVLAMIYRLRKKRNVLHRTQSK